MSNFEKVKSYLADMGFLIVYEDQAEELVIVENEERGIKNLILDCEEGLLIIEQLLFEIHGESLEMYKTLLQKNRDMVHGAFAIDSEGKNLLFRDTLQLDNLDANELDASINALELMLSEFSDEIISFSKL
jgi:hypothetical protein